MLILAISCEDGILFRAARSADETKKVLTDNAKMFDLTLVTTIPNVENKFYCIDVDIHKSLKFEWTCEKINTIYVTKNIAIDCKENHLPIFFYVFNILTTNLSFLHLLREALLKQ